MAGDSVTVAIGSGAVSGLLGVLAILGRRFESRETRAVSTQSGVLADLEKQNARLIRERDEARAELDALKARQP